MSRHRNVTAFRGCDNEVGLPNGLRVKEEPQTPRGASPLPYDPDEEFNRLFEELKMEPDSPFAQPLSRPSLSLSDLTSLRSDVRLDLSERPRVHQQEIMQRYSRKPANSPSLSRHKFVSMAEAIYHFQRDTPGRFHTIDCRAEFRPRGGSPLLTRRTRPQSPVLRCATRVRPVRLLTHDQREEMELEEIRKYKIKANPVPRTVLVGGHLPDVVRRERTVPEPFNLTELPQRPPPEPEPEFKFTARPVPRCVLEKPHLPHKSQSTVTQPITPTFLKNRAHSHENVRRPPTPPPVRRAVTKLHKHKSGESSLVEVPHHGVAQLAVRNALGPLRMEPFSFEKRDEFRRIQKEEKIKRIIEEEKGLACQFKAKPVPKVIKKKARELMSSKCSTTSSENKENYKFEAKPPLVLAQKPFKPILTQTQTTDIRPFALTTERRAGERELFDKQLKEKEEEMKRLAEEREIQKRQQEESEMARLRAQLVHHAQPVPDLVPFVPEKSNAPLTEPQTPMFVRRMKNAQ